MTFMRNFMNLLNMDNWKRYKDEKQDEENQSSDTIADKNTEQNNNNYEMSPIDDDLAIDATPVINESESMEKNTDTEKMPLTVGPSIPAACKTVNSAELIKSSSNDHQVSIPDDLLHLNKSILQEQIDCSFNVPSEKKIIIPFTKETYSFDPNYIDFKLFNRFWKSNKPILYLDNYSSPKSYTLTDDDHILYCIILLLYKLQNHAPVSPDKFNSSFYYYQNHNVANAPLIYQYLLKNGYFKSPNIMDVLHSYHIPELKAILRNCGAKVTGNKTDLIDRIINVLPKDDLNNILNSCDYLVISEKGASLLADNFDLIDFNKHGYELNISLSEFIQWRIYDNKICSYNDTCFRVLTAKVHDNLSTFNYHRLDYIYLHLCELELNLDHPAMAVEYFIRYVYILICDTQNIRNYCDNQDTSYAYEYYSHYGYLLPTSLPLTFNQLQKYYSPQLANHVYCTPEYPPCLLTLNEFIDLFHDMETQIVFDREKYEKIMTDREYQLWYSNKQ